MAGGEELFKKLPGVVMLPEIHIAENKAVLGQMLPGSFQEGPGIRTPSHEGAKGKHDSIFKNRDGFRPHFQMIPGPILQNMIADRISGAGHQYLPGGPGRGLELCFQTVPAITSDKISQFIVPRGAHHKGSSPEKTSVPGKVGGSAPGAETISEVIHNNFPGGNNITLIIHSISSPAILSGLRKLYPASRFPKTRPGAGKPL
jgi:hypothetical protein